MSLYRVRDKNYPDKKGTVWGENLSYDDAHKLKEQVCGTGKSTTARIEPMSADENATAAPTAPTVPFNDPYLLEAQRNATRAASGFAADAQRRADALAARQKQEQALANMTPPELPAFDEGDLDASDLELDEAPDDLEDDLLDDATP